MLFLFSMFHIFRIRLIPENVEHTFQSPYFQRMSHRIFDNTSCNSAAAYHLWVILAA